MSTFTPEFIKQQREMIGKVSKLPWRGDRMDGSIKYGVFAADHHPDNGYDDAVLMADPGVETDSGFVWAGNFRNEEYFFAAANNYPAALAEIERLRGALQNVIEAAGRISDSPDHESALGTIDNMIGVAQAGLRGEG